MEMLIRAICLVGGYGVGLIQTAYIYGRIKGVDIRKYGSGNAGTTNALRVLGKKAGLIVFLGDFLKGIIACSLTHIILGQLGIGNAYMFVLYTGLGVVLGHNFPFYMQFKGGKGIAASGGMIVGLFMASGAPETQSYNGMFFVLILPVLIALAVFFMARKSVMRPAK